MIKTKTFEIEYNCFEPGTKVIATSPRSQLFNKGVFTVKECHEPAYYSDEAILFAEGYEFGIDANYVREATAEEIKELTTE